MAPRGRAGRDRPASKSTASKGRTQTSSTTEPRRSTRQTISQSTQNSDDGIDESFSEHESPESDPAPAPKRGKTQKGSPGTPDAKDKVKLLHYKLRKLCREVLSKPDSKFEDGGILKIWLGGKWEYKFDPDVRDSEALDKKWAMKDDLLVELRREVYHNCIVTSLGAKFQQLLKKRGIHEDNIKVAADRCCDGQYTKLDTVGAKIKRDYYIKLCAAFRKLALEQTTTYREKCFKSPLLQFGPGSRQGAGATVQASAKRLSDTSVYNTEWAWLKTCEFEDKTPVKSGTEALPASSNPEIGSIVQAITKFLCEHARDDADKVDGLWTEMVTAVFELGEKDMVTAEERRLAHRRAREIFEEDARDVMLAEGMHEHGESWHPTPSQEVEWMRAYWLENDGDQAVDKEAEAAIAAKQKVAVEDWNQNKLAMVVGKLSEALKNAVSNHPLLKFDEDGTIQRITT